MTATDYGLHREPVEVPAALRMAGEIMRSFETYLAESGCPLTAEQQAVMDAAHAEIAQQQVAS